MYRVIRANQEIYGMATVGRHIKPNFMIAVTPDTNREGLCYFKYLNSDNYNKATSIARIDIRQPSRIYHKDGTGKQEWKLNHKDKKVLCDYLDEINRNYRKQGITNWQMLLYHWNNEHGFFIEEPPEDYETDVEAFVHGFYDTDHNLSDPNYTESDLKRPDYTLLEN